MSERFDEASHSRVPRGSRDGGRFSAHDRRDGTNLTRETVGERETKHDALASLEDAAHAIAYYAAFDEEAQLDYRTLEYLLFFAQGRSISRYGVPLFDSPVRIPDYREEGPIRIDGFQDTYPGLGRQDVLPEPETTGKTDERLDSVAYDTWRDAGSLATWKLRSILVASDAYTRASDACTGLLRLDDFRFGFVSERRSVYPGTQAFYRFDQLDTDARCHLCGVGIPAGGDLMLISTPGEAGTAKWAVCTCEGCGALHRRLAERVLPDRIDQGAVQAWAEHNPRDQDAEEWLDRYAAAHA